MTDREIAPRPRPTPQSDDYRPPAITWLGSLAELTRGGSGPNNDGFGGSGASGSL
jgi:hypothetical protein